jgi:hypothetical protein
MNSGEKSINQETLDSNVRHFVGISLGGAKGKNTALAQLQQRGSELVLTQAQVREGTRGGGWMGEGQAREPDANKTGALFRDENLVAHLRGLPADRTVVAIDVPLTFPPCVRCHLACPGSAACEVPQVVWMRRHARELAPMRGRSERDKPSFRPYTERATDVIVAHLFDMHRDALGPSLGPLAARAHYLQRVLAPAYQLNRNLLEVLPRLTIASLCGDGLETRTRLGAREQVWSTRKAVLAQLAQGVRFAGVWPEMVVRNMHVFHAVICAMTAWLRHIEDWQGPSDIVASLSHQQKRANALGERGSDGQSVVMSALESPDFRWNEDGWTWFPPAAKS